jgi:hypothetical protein
VDSEVDSGLLASRKCAGSVALVGCLPSRNCAGSGQGPVALVGFLDSHWRIGFDRNLTSMNLLFGLYIENLIWFRETHNLANPFLQIQKKPKFNNTTFTRTLKPKPTRRI